MTTIFNASRSPSESSVPAATPKAENTPVGDERSCKPFAAEATLVLLSNVQSLLQQELSRGLLEDGIALSELRSPAPLSRSVQSRPALILSLSTEEADATEHHRHAGCVAAECDAAWIAVSRIHRRFLLVGPPLFKSSKPCYACVSACADAWLQGHVPPAEDALLPESAQAAFATAVISDAVTQALAALPGDWSIAGEPEVLLYDLQDLSSTSLLVGRVPGCSICWPSKMPGDLNGERRVALPALFEECSRIRLTGRAIESTGLPKQFAKNTQASRARSYPNSLRVPLPPWPVLYRERNVLTKGEFRLQELSALLFLTFGRWNEADARRPDRVLPSAGNLSSPGAFLVVRNVAGLKSGVYYYLEASHELARIESAGTGTVEDLLSGLCVSPDSGFPDALLVMVGSYARIGVKYGALAYRLVHFDSGLFVAHLRTAAHSLSLTVHEMDSWPDKTLAERLAIDTQKSPITAAIAFSGRNLLQPRISTPAEACEVIGGFTSFFHHEARSAADLAQQIHYLSRAELLFNWKGVRVQSSSGFVVEEQAIPPLDYSYMELWNQLLTRQSVRSFEDTLVAPPVMAAILRRVSDLAHSRAKTPFVTVLATLRSGSAAQPEWQTFDLSRGGHITTYGAAAVSSSLDELFVHPPPAKAPLLFWLCGDVRHGAWQYRRMLLEAGQQAYDLMQEAACYGLQGVFVGGIWPKRIGSKLGLRFCDESPLLAFACGLPQLCSRGE